MSLKEGIGQLRGELVKIHEEAARKEAAEKLDRQAMAEEERKRQRREREEKESILRGCWYTN